MKTLASTLLATAAAFAAAGTATFDDLALAPNSYENGSHLNGSFVSGGVTFLNDYNATYDFSTGFSYSNVNNPTTPGYANQFAAITGTAHDGTNYGVGYDESTFRLSADTTISGLYITNTTYAALSMQNGDSFAKKFGGASGNDADFFSVVATGYAGGVATGAAEFYLGDYRAADNAQDYIVRDWRWFDLSGLGAATEVRFSYRSSDVGSFGINTPVYFALDGVQTQAVPEPASMAALALGVAAFVRRRVR